MRATSAPAPHAAAAAAERRGPQPSPARFLPLEAPSRASQLGVVAREELLALVGRVERAHASLDDAVRGDGCVACVPDDGAGGLKTKKHAVQNEAIVDAIGRLGLVDASPAVHVEFGAGKGGLTQALAARCAPSEHVLVDRFTPVNSVDRHTRDAVGGWTRLKMDIRHLRLRGVPVVWPDDEPAGLRRSAIGKHLCGAATDFTLRSVVGAGENARAAIDGVVIATCCHHRCEFGHYVNQPFVAELGFSERDFAIIALLSSWATDTAARPAAAPAAAAAPAGRPRPPTPPTTSTRPTRRRRRSSAAWRRSSGWRHACASAACASGCSTRGASAT